MNTIDVEMDQFNEPEFEDTGDFDIDEDVVPEGSLDVSMNQDMTF